MRWFLPLALILLIGGCDVKIQRGGIEPPPPEYRGRGLAPGAKLVELGSPQEVDAVCRDQGIGPNEFQRMSGKYTLGCYSPKTHTVYMIRRGLVPDSYWNELFDHEASAHSNGLVHVERGRGWKQAPNVFAQQPMTHDWSKVFGATTQPPAGANLFKGR